MRSIFSIKLPSKVSAGQDVKASHFNALLDSIQAVLRELEARTLKGSADIGVKEAGGKVTLWIKRRFGRGGSSAEDCPFGKAETWTEGEGEEAVTKKGINGGRVYCGPENWDLSRHEIDTSSAGRWRLSLKIQVEAARDDDNEYLLPGLVGGTRPEHEDGGVSGWDLSPYTEENESTTDYPSNVPPDVATGLGTKYVPLGKVIVDDSGGLKLLPVDCGDIELGHCNANLTHERV